MEKVKQVWDVESDKFVVYEEGLKIKRKLLSEENAYINSCEITLNKEKRKEILDTMTYLWNSDSNNPYQTKQVEVDELNKVKLSLYFDKKLQKQLLKFSLISKATCKKEMDYIKLGINESRQLYLNLRKSIQG
ncbi:hypothetical protein [Clostridium disporicum]|uniref:hypothetical protein n=1 Tax=Clostridium disporicum TaxID=84024 RepID=UPI0034A31257